MTASRIVLSCSQTQSTMIVEIECICAGAEGRDVIDKAIEIVSKSGLKYEVGAMGTTIEGEPDKMWPLLRCVHESCFSNGACAVTSYIKVKTSEQQPELHRSPKELHKVYRVSFRSTEKKENNYNKLLLRVFSSRKTACPAVHLFFS